MFVPLCSLRGSLRISVWFLLIYATFCLSSHNLHILYTSEGQLSGEENLVKNIENKVEQALKKPESNDSNGERRSSRYNGLEPPPPYREEFLTEEEKKDLSKRVNGGKRMASMEVKIIEPLLGEGNVELRRWDM
ncbi:Uncharacterized protein Fot_17642 [Forsythia ovata]|uniref:Uncharacterized protein n=1 Tax=Forsythia ovata TaxID=205694 RepID=A0ABD1VFX5_9LAMI